MPLPDSNTEWPPKPHEKVLAAAAEQQVWWEGDPAKLAAFYGGRAGDAAALGRIRRTVKAASAAWWGKQHTPGKEPKRLHVPVAADICRISASTLFSSPVTFTDPAENTAVTEVIDDLLNTEDTHSRLLVAAESASALSGVYGRVVWDQSVADHAWIDWVDADRAVGEWQWGHLTAVTFWTELDSDDDRTVWRHLERYERGVIHHGLYQGTTDKLGQRRDLDHHDATAALDDTVTLKVPELAARYVPNHRPAPQWRGTPALRDLGRSDLTTDVIHLMDAIDHTWSSWMNDLEMGRGRIVITDDLATSLGPGRGTTFDTDSTVFTRIGPATSPDGSMVSLIEAHQFDIRVDEHQRTYVELLRRAISRVGFSPITFGIQDEVAATATEVDAKERDTNATRSARIRLWAPLADLATILLRVNSAQFGTAAPSERLEVEWPSMHQVSDRQIAETVDLWERARAASSETKIRMLHPEWDDQRVQDEVSAIASDSALPTSIIGPTETDFGPQGDEQPVETPGDNPFDQA